MDKSEYVFEMVRSVRRACLAGTLDLRNDCSCLNPKLERVVPLLCASFPWKDVVPGWTWYRDQVVKNWPPELNLDREMHGLLD